MILPMNNYPIFRLISRVSGRYLSRCGWLPLVFLSLNAHADTTHWAYPVRQGDTLISISNNYLQHPNDWVKLQKINRIKNTKRLPPGLQLQIPIKLLKLHKTAAEIVRVQREVEITPAAGGAWLTAAPGTLLRMGDKIRTGKDSNITLRFADGSRLMVMENSLLTLDEMTVYGKSGAFNTRMKLQNGQVETQVVPLKNPAAYYEIITPAIAVGVRGTDFRVGADADNAISRSEVLQGFVAVEAAGIQLSIPAGFGTLAEQGKPPLPPVALLKGPDLTGLPVLLQSVPLRFKWPALDGAASYRAQVFADEEFQKLLLDGTFSGNEAKWLDLPDGNYFLRVRALDKQGLEGLNTGYAFTLNARPEPPFVSAPADQEKLYGDKVKFQWTKPAHADGYHIQLARNPGLTAPVSEIFDLKDLHYTATLEPGDYYWRIASRILPSDEVSGEEGPFSDTRSFTVKRIPVAPAVSSPKIDKEQMMFQWSSGEAGQKYQFQLARDEGFNDLLTDQTLSESNITLARPGAGSYFMRAKAIDADGFAGTFGAPQRVEVPRTMPWWLIIPLGLFALAL